MQLPNTTAHRRWPSTVRLLGGLFVGVALLFFVGCDSNDSGMNGNGDGNGNGNGNGGTAALTTYDTTTVDGEPTIRVTDDEGAGVAYTDADGNQVDEVTWSSDFNYILEEFIFVNEGQTLTIEPGTVIKGAPGSGEDATALIVSSGGQINADGNPDSDDPSEANPIIFTAQADDVADGGGGLGRDVRGEWGGVILLGNAPLNTEPGTQIVEGIPDDFEERAEYGGDNAEHNVGTFRFVQIRHSGSQLAAGDEIQGLTLGGLGRQSTVEYVESYASSDDGFEWFGGTVNTKHLVSAFNADDAFDIDQGHQGNHQFWFVVQSPEAAGRAAEQDGGTDPEDGTPLATSKTYNATYIGVGPGNSAGGGNDPFVIHRDNNASSYFNSVFVEGGRNAGLQIEDLFGDQADSRLRQENGDLIYQDNFWWNIGPDYGDDTAFEDIIQITEIDTTDDGMENPVPVDEDYRGQLADYLRDNNNQTLDVGQKPVSGISRMEGGGSLDPTASGPATSGAPSPSTDFENDGVNGSFEDVGYYGAFGPNENWAAGWTTLDAAGYFNN